MNQSLIEHVNRITLPNSNRTIGSEKALAECTENHGKLQITLQFGYPVNHIRETLLHEIQATCQAHYPNLLPEITIHHHIITHKVQPGVSTLKGVKNIIAVASGKGGVGKSTTAANLALACARMGARVGVLDADLYGPSQPTMFGVAGHQPEQRNNKLIPITAANGIQVMSIGFLIEADQAVVWRGPMVSQALQQLLFQCEWDNVDYLFVDLPPGTGDIQLTLSQKIPVTGSVVVTTPQDIALIDAKKAVNMFEKVNIPIIGILENMSVHICSQCGHSESIFGCGGGQSLAENLQVPLLGQLPLTLPLRLAMDEGKGSELFDQHPEVARLYTQAAWQTVLAVHDKGKDYSGIMPKVVVQ